MVDACKMEKYLNIGPVRDLILVTKYTLDSWSREEKGEWGRRDRKGEDGVETDIWF